MSDGAVADGPAPVESGPLADILDEGRRIALEAARAGVLVRLIGGVAVSLHTRQGVHPALARSYGDIDLATPRREGRDTQQLLESLGYTPNERFNALNGALRLVFYDVPHRRQVDIFVGEFAMCHTLPICDRLALDSQTVPLAELLLTKLQIVRLNPKDVSDIHALLIEHEVGESDDDTINAPFIADLLARDWGLWRTTKGSIATARGSLSTSGLSQSEQGLVAERLDRLWEQVEARPKSLRWKSRSRIGERARWYEEPEEIAHREPGES